MKILSWLKKNWIWIVLPVGILLVALKIFRLIKPDQHTVVVTPAKPTIAADVALHDNMTLAKERQAEAATAAEIKKIEEKHQEALDKLNDAQRLQYEELKKKPAQEITNWLLKVGKGDA